LKSVFHLITTISRGGAENQLLVLVKEQVKLGLNVHVVYLKGEPELEAEFLQAGASIHHDLAGKKPVLQPFILKGILAGQRPVVHAHLPRAELVAFLIPARINLFTSRHNAEPFFPGKPRCISNLLSKLVELRSIRIIAISNAVRDYLIERGEVRKPHNVEVVLYGYKTHFERAQIESRDNSQIKHIGTISRLADQKDLPTMFAALKEFQVSQPMADLAILGAGPLEVQLKELVSEMNLNSSVSFLGRSSEIYDFLRTLDVFILTSKYEGFGMVLLEAMDAGIPIVASNNSAIPEVLGKEFPGLCKTSDVSEFVEKMRRLSDPDYRKLVLMLQEIRLETFEAEIMCQKISKIYSL
jgi:glycosyltransferase involved in cell wall biosynthesis